MDNEYLRRWIELYGNPMYSGEAEIYGNPNTVGAAASHTQIIPQGLLNLGGGVDYVPRAEDKLIPYGFAEYRNPAGLNLKGMMDEYSKSLSGQYGNVGANITKENGMTEMSARALANMLGGEASLDAYKNPYDRGLMFNFTKTF